MRRDPERKVIGCPQLQLQRELTCRTIALVARRKVGKWVPSSNAASGGKISAGLPPPCARWPPSGSGGHRAACDARSSGRGRYGGVQLRHSPSSPPDRYDFRTVDQLHFAASTVTSDVFVLLTHSQPISPGLVVTGPQLPRFLVKVAAVLQSVVAKTLP